MTQTQDIRWQQRFNNYMRAMALLRDALAMKPLAEFSALEREGIVQRFEYCYELGWKTLKDYLEYMGVYLEQSTPRFVVKKAFEANIIADGKAWIAMIEARNLMAHTYDQKAFERIVSAIKEQYFPTLDILHDFFLSKRV